MQEKFQNKSFTLIEMLVVVVIIGILAVALVPRLVGARERASDSARIVKVGQISSAVELYAQEKGTTYPLAPLTTTGTSIAKQDITDAISPYLSTIPTDPGKGTVAISTAPGGIQVTGDSFAYWTNDAGTRYAITALMESKKGNTTNGTGVIDSDKQGGYQKVGKGLTTKISIPGVIDTSEPGVYHDVANQEIIVTNGTITYVIQDKNVGASVAGTGPASYGWFFQWGNNFGFWNGQAGYTNEDGDATIVTTGTLVSNPSIPYKSSTFVILGGYIFPNDWATPQNDNLRPSGSQGPCEAGYHVPSLADWIGLLDVRASLPGKVTDYRTGYDDERWADFENNVLGNDLKLPVAGFRNGNSTDGIVEYPGNFGDYRSSTAPNAGYPNMSYALAFRDYYAFIDNSWRVDGVSVRCFKN